MARSPKPESNPLLPLPLPAPVFEHHISQNVGPLMRQWYEQRRVPPVLLLTGAEGVGKRSVTHYLAQWLLCDRNGFQQRSSERGLFDEGPSLFGENAGAQASGSGENIPRDAHGNPAPCGQCPSCQRALRGNWLDFTEIGVDEESGESGSLKIEQFRRLKETLGFGAFDGAFKITLIRQADRMTIQAANSLLKILEEPPAGWIFFMTAAEASLLLPTLVSRCQTLRLKPFPQEALKKLLEDEGVPADKLSACAQLAQGSWGKALSFTRDEVWDRRESIFRFVEDPKSELGALVDWAASEPANFDFLLSQLEQVASDLVRWTVTPGTAPGASHDGRRALSAHASALTRKLGSAQAAREFWITQAQKLFRARQLASAPLNRKVLTQDLLIPWLNPNVDP